MDSDGHHATKAYYTADQPRAPAAVADRHKPTVTAVCVRRVPSASTSHRTHAAPCRATLVPLRKKKVKLAVLKMYRVDDDGKITRLRKECPADTCGAGVFMAQHYDRHYCGKCGLTYRVESLNKN